MIKKEDAFPVFLPNPAIAKSNIDGHMIDKNKPPEIKKFKFQYLCKLILIASLIILIFKSINVFPAFYHLQNLLQ
jgi:hypothetical protein